MALAILLCAVLSPAGAVPLPPELAGTCTIKFAGTSTLHGFSGTAPDIDFTLRRVPGTALWRTRIDLPVAGMSTGNGWRDSNMRKMFDAEHDPLIRASFPAIDPVAAAPAAGREDGILSFTLQIRDVSRPVTSTVRHWQLGADTLSFAVEARVSLRDFGLDAPTAMGFIRVHDEVVLTVHATVRARPTTTPRTHGKAPPVSEE